MSEFVDISAALEKHLNDLSGKPPIAWENDGYEPVIGTLYVRATNLQGDTYAETEQDRTDGIYQLDVIALAGAGKGEATVMADTLADRFKQDTEITYGSAKVTVKTASRRNGFNKDGWYSIILEIVYYAYTDRR